MLTHPPKAFFVGDTWEIQGDLFYADGTPFDLGAGCNIQWALKDSMGGTVLAAALGGGIIVLDPSGGVCLVTIRSDQSGGVSVGQYTDQLRATDPAGYVSTQWRGIINAKASFKPAPPQRFFLNFVLPRNSFYLPVLFPAPWPQADFINKNLGAVPIRPVAPAITLDFSRAAQSAFVPVLFPAPWPQADFVNENLGAIPAQTVGFTLDFSRPAQSAYVAVLFPPPWQQADFVNENLGAAPIPTTLDFRQPGNSALAAALFPANWTSVIGVLEDDETDDDAPAG